MGLSQDRLTNSENEVVIIQTAEELKNKPKKWYYYVWDTLDKPKEERWFMFKLDAALLTFASLGTLDDVELVDHELTLSKGTSSNILTRRTSTALLCLGCKYGLPL
jgi:hypothetical protein